MCIVDRGWFVPSMVLLLICDGWCLHQFSRLNANDLADLAQTCGTSLISEKNSRAYKIFNGQTAKQGQFPWALKLMRQDNDDTVASCTAELISRWHIVTAAHCLKLARNIRRSDCRKITVLGGSSCVYTATYGTERQCDERVSKEPRFLKLKSAIMPESSATFVKTHGVFKKMKSNSDNNTSETEIPFSDIAILELRKPIDLSDKDLRPICLPNPLKAYPKHFIEFGFGYTNVEEWQRGDVGNMQLKWFTTEIDSFCNRSRKFTYLNLDCNRTIFSFRDTIGSEIGVCKGDSGGGLSSVVNGRHTLFGVLSLANKRCNEPPNFEIFTSTTAYHDFICYYTGVCPMGFNRYVDHAYARHPESVISDSSDAEMFVTIAKNRQSSVRQTMQLWCLLVCQMLITRALRYL